MDASGVRLNAVGVELPVWMCELDEDLFGESNGKKWKTRREKREERQR